MKRPAEWSPIVAALVVAFLPTLASASSYDDAFAKLKSLVGTWDVDGEARQVTYSLTGGGETVIESFTGETTMASFYHRDGDALRLTHYCNAGNQPRMKAVGYDPVKRILNFEFVDVTNLLDSNAYHTRDLEIRFIDKTHIILAFSGRKDGESIVSSLWLTRRND